MKPRSLRSQLIAGFVFWTLGLIGMSVLGKALSGPHPEWRWMIHLTFPIVAGLVFLGLGVWVVRRGLTPFRALRDRLAAVRDGRAARLEGEYPLEIVALVDDLNALLDERDRRVARASARAGDLAHGLKTPLTIVAQDVERADAAGQHEVAASIRGQVERMRRQIDSHLARARVSAAGAMPGARASVSDAARGLARTMERLYADRALAIAVEMPAELAVRVSAEDLEEMLGNLLDNACKWAKSRVSMTAMKADARIVIDVDDDGTGLPPSMRGHVFQRGVRADEATPGSGLGLAIVQDLADAYGGSVALEPSAAGGVRARLTLPAAS